MNNTLTRSGADWTPEENARLLSLVGFRTWQEIDHILSRKLGASEWHFRAMYPNAATRLEARKHRPMDYYTASSLLDQILRDCPYVSAAQGKQGEHWFVSVCLRSPDGKHKVDERIAQPVEWPTVRAEIQQFHSRWYGEVAA